MSSRVRHFMLAGLVIQVWGCTAVPDLPATLSVAISGNESVDAAIDTGPSSLANAIWSISRKADPSDEDQGGPPPLLGLYGGLLTGEGLPRPPISEPIFLLRFGPGGEMVEVTENRFFIAEIYGSEFTVGGDSAALIPGLVSNSASYGVQIGDRFGLAVVIHVRFFEIYLGTATMFAWGTVEDDQLDGTFGYEFDFTGGAMFFLGVSGDQYPVEGQRVFKGIKDVTWFRFKTCSMRSIRF